MIEQAELKLTSDGMPRNSRITSESIIGVDSELAAASETSLLRASIARLEKQLDAKTKLCEKLEATLCKMLGEAREDISRDYFHDQLQTWKAQVWFKRPVPSLVDGIYEALKLKIEHAYEVDKRRTAFTMIECENIVDEIREKWEKDIPLSVSRSLTVDNKVYASANERSNGAGNIVEAVHYLVYLVFKLYNRAAHVLHTIKKKEGFASLNADTITLSQQLEIKEGKSTGVTVEAEVESGTKWYDNPQAALLALIGKARKSVQLSMTMSTQGGCEKAIVLTVTKLIGSNKPNLAESLRAIASIIALREYAAARAWKFEGIKIHA